MDKKKTSSRGIALWKYLLGAWMAVVILFVFLGVGEAARFAPGTSRIMLFHLPMAIMCVIAFWTSMVYAIHVLRRREPAADLKSECAAELGLLFGILATITGSIFAASNWNSFWNWDPRETSMLVLLLIYGAYFGLRSAVEDEERRATLAAVYNVFSGIIMPFLVFVVPRLPSVVTSHPTDTYRPANTGVDYKVAFYSSLLGYLGLFIWMFQLRLRAGWIARRQEEGTLSSRAMVE